MTNSYDRIVVTGGAGFIGSHLAEELISETDTSQIIVIDKLTYAGSKVNLRSFDKNRRFTFINADVCNYEAMNEALVGADCVFHLAAESHVDRSFQSSKQFFETNIIGTQVVVESCIAQRVKKFILVSTDEVYGPRLENDEATEDSDFCPTNPYSVSKVASELIARSVCRNQNLKPIILRPNNIFGERQYPEKIIPKFISRAYAGKTMEIHGRGDQQRRFLSVKDFSAAAILILEKGIPGEVYNVGIDDSYSVLDIAYMVSSFFGQDFKKAVKYVQDRPYNDFYYSTDTQKLKNLGWSPSRKLSSDAEDLFPAILAYLKNIRKEI